MVCKETNKKTGFIFVISLHFSFSTLSNLKKMKTKQLSQLKCVINIYFYFSATMTIVDSTKPKMKKEIRECDK